jgi:hypothetical protein
MIVIRADIVNTVFGLLEAVRRKFDLVLERVLTEVVRPTTTDFIEKRFPAMHKLADRLNPPEFVGAGRLL